MNEATYAYQQPCRLFRDPLGWLQGGCQGGVILDSQRAAPIIARAPGKLACEDANHARGVVLNGATTFDRLVVPQTTQRAAA